MKRILAAISASILALTAMAGCGTYTSDDNASSSALTSSGASAEDSGSQSASEPMTFTFIGGHPVTLNPILSQSSDDGNSFYLLESGLFRYNENGVQNEICENYDVSEDGLTYTFHLREANWSDGEPITAEQFAYTLQCFLSPDMGSPSASTYYDILNAEAFNNGSAQWEEVGVAVLDDQTLEITLAEPTDDFILTLATSGLIPLRQDFVEEQGESFGSSIDSLQYSGPYTLTEWTLDSSITFTKNPEYWNAENSFPVETITLLKVDDSNTAYSMFENGEVDALANVSNQYLDALADYITIETGANGLMYLWINQNGMSEDAGKVLSNNNFRLALNYALDREATVNAITQVDTPLQPAHPSFL